MATKKATKNAKATPPDYEKGIAKGRKRQISLTIAGDLLRQVDEAAKRMGQTRAGLINLAIYRALEGDLLRHP